VGGAVAEFRALDTEPYGVNPGDAASHQAFIEALDLPFDLLVDEGRRVAAAYGAIKPDGSGIARTVVLVGKDGRVHLAVPGAPPNHALLAAIERTNDGS
jgi:peroxiredoxin Q/BCP